MCTASVATRTSGHLTVLSCCLVSLSFAGLSGCRSARDNQIDLLERELRTQEDYIYELEDYVLKYSEKLRECRCTYPHQVASQSSPAEPELAGEPDLRAADDQQSEVSSNELPEPTAPPAEPEESTTPLPDEMDIPELELESGEPVGEFESPHSPDQRVLSENRFGSNATALSGSIELTTALDSDPSSEEIIDEAEYQEVREESLPDPNFRMAERLVITKLFRGNVGELPLASLLTIVEARDANDEPVDFNGKASLMIMTADENSPQRLKRWDFTAEETLSAWQSSQLGDGLHLELPLGESTLPDESLELWVRLVAEDGTKLLTQVPFERERLTTVNFELEAQELLALEKAELAETGARPLKQPEIAGQASDDAQSQWRAAMQRTHALEEGFASTDRASKGWTAQPASGREPLSTPAASTARQRTSTHATDPIWTAGRSSNTWSQESK